MLGFYVVQNAWSYGQDPYRPLHQLAVVINTIDKHYIEEPHLESLIHKAIYGMVEGLDPHSRYLGPKEF